MRHGKHGFLDCDIRRLTIRQEIPGNERTIKLFGRGVGPARPQQSLVRERSIQADAVQCLLCPLKVARFEQEGAKHQVGLVADGKAGGIIPWQQPGFVQLLDCFLFFTGLQQSDPEVVGDKPGEARIILQVIEHFDAH